MTKRININGIEFEASNPIKGEHGTTWMVSPIGKRGQPLKATYAARETDGAFRIGGRLI